MKREVIDLQEERQIIINMIISTDFLQQVISLAKPTLFQSKYAKQVTLWIKEYWEAYKQAPGKNIQSLYMQKAQTIQDEEENETIADFLRSLSEGAEKLHNVDYSVNSAIRYLKLRSLQKAKELLEDALLSGDPSKGEQVIANYSRIERPTGEGVDLLKDTEQVKAAFIMDDEILFSFPGALGKVCGSFNRGDLSAWEGFMKRGKTWFLWYTAQVAMEHSLKVLFITLEMTKKQIVRRAWQSLVGCPKYDKEVLIPYFQKIEGMEEIPLNSWEILGRKEERKKVDIEKILNKQKKFRRLLQGVEVRLMTFPSYSATVDDIIMHMDNLYYYDNFQPDLLITDYADIVKPIGKQDYRLQIDAIWKRLRGLAQERNIHVCTASQVKVNSHGRDIEESDSAENIQKLAHVAKMMAINSTKGERKRGIVRIEQIAEREDISTFEQAVVLQCFDIGKCCLDSRLFSEVYLGENDEN